MEALSPDFNPATPIVMFGVLAIIFYILSKRRKRK
jgi:LPXTG-motif cell wall-anchored protein